MVIDELDPGMDGDWLRMIKTYGIGLVRNSAHVNWKYAHHPVLNYRVRVAQSYGKPTGYIVWRLSPDQADDRRAVITDFLVEKGDTKTLEFLVSHAIIEAAEAGMEVLSSLTSQSWAARLLRGYGFLPRGEAHGWVIGCAQGHIPSAWVTDHEPWHMCTGDSDGDMWMGSVRPQP